MCLILVAVNARPDLPLLIAANRDEFYSRPTAAAAPWDESPHVIGGRDLREGGSWLGITATGRWAAVTNFREAREASREGAPSRGILVAEYLQGSMTPAAYLADLATRADRFSGFNLLVGDRRSLRWFSNRAGDHPRHDQDLPPGIYGLSNHLLDTPWPKIVEGKRELERVLESGADPDLVLAGLLDRTLAKEADLPRSGVPLEMERALSARFITGTDYGTRASTVVRIGADGHVLLLERSFHPPAEVELTRHEFHLPS